MSEAGLRCSMASLDLEVTIRFPTRQQAELARELVADRVSGARLPVGKWQVLDDASDARVRASVQADDAGGLTVSYGGAVSCPPYAVDRAGFHWDFTRIVTALAFPQLLDTGMIPVHAACLLIDGTLVLLPGSSGAGKSSLSFAALGAGHRVIATELAFIRDLKLVASNSRLSIDPGALKFFGLATPSAVEICDGRVTVETQRLDGPTRVDRLVFPRVTTGAVHHRPITPRRARMLLFQNVISELPVSQLISHESHPLGGAITGEQYATIADQVAKLSQLDPQIIEGPPASVLNAVSDR